MIFSNETNSGESPRRAADTEGDDPLFGEAAAWVVRRDRGLSTREMLALDHWIAADPRHADAFARAEAGWGGLDFIAQDLAQEILASAKPRPRLSLFVAVPLAAAAALVLVLWMGRAPREEADTRASPFPVPTLIAGASPTQHTLSDGSRLSLNHETEIAEVFTERERRLRLLRGEGHFDVSKDPRRPFVVEAGGVEVRAVGTAFNVSLHSASLEVLVTEGVVELGLSRNQTASSPQRPNEEAAALPNAQTLRPHQHASVALVSERSDPLKAVEPIIVVTTLEPEAVARAIAWQEPLRRLRGMTLAELALGLEQRTGQRVVFADTEMGELRLGGRFRADDPEGFVSVVSTLLDVEVERGPSGELVVRKKVKERDSGK